MADHLGQEGWYTDPYGRHDARWLSDGHPTKLVRDGSVESYDEPPDERPSRDPVKLEPDPVGSASDLLRADDAQDGGTYDADKATRAVLDIMDQLPPAV